MGVRGPSSLTLFNCLGDLESFHTWWFFIILFVLRMKGRERDVNFVFFNEKLRYLRGVCGRVRFEQLV